MVKVTFLGTNGWYDTATGVTVSVLIEHKDYNLVLDAGNGICKLNQLIDSSKPVYLFLSHFHLDHTNGLHTLALNSFPKGLTIITQKGGREILNQLINVPYTVSLEKLPFKTDIIETDENIECLPFKVNFLPLVHSTFVLGGRFDLDGTIITYCTDTAYCDNAVKLAKDADILITECSMLPKESKDEKVHLNPELASKIAKEATAKKLYLMHFDAKTYTSLEHRTEAVLVARKTFTNTYAAFDELQIKI